MENSSHENFAREEIAITGSDRSFGFTIAGALLLLASLSWWRSSHIWPWFVGIAILLLISAAAIPAVLRPLNRLWLRLALLLHKFANPVIMAVMFYGTVWPTGLIMRARGRDLLRLKLDPAAESYWIVRDRKSLGPETLKNQF